MGVLNREKCVDWESIGELGQKSAHLWDFISYNHRLRVSAHAAGKIFTVVILGLATAESLQFRFSQLLENLYINQKLVFMTLSIPLYIQSLWF